MNPFTTFRTLRDIARRRPFLVGAVGVGLLIEAARVGEVLLFGGTVTIFGHSGAEEWRTADGEPWIAGYVAWVGLCGFVVLGLAIAGRRSGRGAVGAPPASQAPAPIAAPAAKAGSGRAPMRPAAPAATKSAPRPAGGAVVWRRGASEKRPDRLR